jgi:Domain of unknown function (DUF4407)
MYANRIEALFTWLGGGEWQELGERHERSTHALAGAVVLLGAALAWLVAALAVASSTDWPMAAVIPLTSVFGLLVGAVSRAISSGPTRGRAGLAGRAAVGVAVGVVVGELAAVVLFSGTIDRLLDGQAAVRADGAPAVAQASAELDQARAARAGLDDAVARALQLRDEALVVARCEYNPSPACPQTHITGLPGAGPENRTANDFLADTTRQLDTATAERDRRAPALDADVAANEQTLTQARTAAAADSDAGLSARWAAMNDDTFADSAAMLLRLLTIAFFVLVYLLPLILTVWRGETTHDRGAAARAARERADLEADTAIAVKRAEVRAAVETMWAEQQLASARLAVEAQTEIEREQQRRRVIEAVAPAVPVESERVQATELTSGDENLPARVEPAGEIVPSREGGGALIPTIPDVTRAATRWLRPFVPPIVASAVETATKPLRGVRHVFEEEEEVHFSLKRSRKVTVHTEEDEQPAEPRATASTVVSARRDHIEADAERHGLPELDGQRQLPPAE